ncbi:iron-containing alcohol dehydrogenase (plasmid) [Halorussus limi]|uniref:Iron-containing alcohol dehydrogenase n=1 Tax=Halorussus limi TaxID=2938695 RepID=A0A8U0I1G2_9EURY|nr:iron-containing alcohol dehydrogenase [Halorussus limi]UPV76731.1 iron-containing alcohol dehydrogenase [Halorussus limi]
MDHRDPVGARRIAFATPETEFGEGVADRLPETLDRLGVDAPLVVTDRGVESAGVLDAALDGLELDPTVYYATTEPSVEDFENLPDAEVDGVVAVGGGSCLDTAKVVAALLAHRGTASDYLGVGRVPGPVAPTVAIPTTSGTGSQATQTAVVSYDGVKRGMSDELLRPDVALVDPALTRDLPRDVTARSGFDAFVHALESLTARDHTRVEPRPINYQGANPITRPISRRALELVHGSYERAVADGDDREARRAMSLGSHLAGTAFSNAGLGAVHALASSVGGMTGRPHGECLAASLTAGLRYNLPSRREQYAAVARTLGVAAADDDTDEAAEALLAECERIRDAVGLPESLADLGLGPDDADVIVENTLIQERRIKTNPRDVGEDLREEVVRALE